MSRTWSLAVLALVLAPAILRGQEPDRQSLFRIERNKNANIVQYDARIAEDGRLSKKDPVVAYWIRLAEQGQVQKLSWIQNTFAFGFSTDLSSDRETALLKLKIDIGRPIAVKRDGEQFRAMTGIAGAQAVIEKFFIHATGKGLSTRVDYIELHGNSVDGGGDLYERIVP